MGESLRGLRWEPGELPLAAEALGETVGASRELGGIYTEGNTREAEVTLGR